MEFLLITALAVAAIVVFGFLRKANGKTRTGAPSTAHDLRAEGFEPSPASKMMQALNTVGVKPTKLLNSSELRLFKIIREACAGINPDLLVFAQPSMGEFLHTEKGAYTRDEERTAYNAFNAKRVDIVVFSPRALPLLGIEFDGAGHHRGNARERDSIKRLAFEKAGIPLMSIEENFSEIELRQRLVAALSRPRPS